LVPAGTPLSVNGGDLGSKQELVPDHEKSTLKLAVWASRGLPLRRKRAIATSSRLTRQAAIGDLTVEWPSL
jgi:hypothetical protein